MSRRHESVFDDPDVAAELSEVHEKFVVVPADKASNNIVFVCKTHYINCLMEELGMSTMTGNPTYNLTAMSKDEILQINVKKITFENKERTTDKKMGVSVLLRLFISSNEVYNTAYAL